MGRGCEKYLYGVFLLTFRGIRDKIILYEISQSHFVEFG